MSSNERDPFYVGWEAQAHPSLGRFVRSRVALLLVAVAAVAGAVAASQEPFAPSRFEFGVERTFEGTLEHIPYPVLVVDRPGKDAGQSRWLLTVFGKRGAEEFTQPLDGRRARFTGSLIHRGTATMVELLPESIEDLGPSVAANAAAPSAPVASAEPVTLTGEIVDAKCHLGVMKPGDLKPHRACAVRCISGGVPPALVVRDADGNASYYLLASADGAPVGPGLLDLVAEPVQVTGRVRHHGDLRVLLADPESFERLH